MAKNDFIVGIDEAIKIYAELPKNIRDSAIAAAAAKALKPVQAASKREILRHAKNTDGRGKTRFIARHIKITRVRGKRPGAKVHVKGPDIYVGSKAWTLQGFAALQGKGSYKTRNRKGKGFYPGFGNYIADTGYRMRHSTKLQFSRGIATEAKRAVDRTIKRYKKRIAA